MNEQEPTPSTTEGEQGSPWVVEALDLGRQIAQLHWPAGQSPSADTEPAASSPDATDQSAAHESAANNEPQARDGPRIYAASLNDYNNGILHGCWIDTVDGSDVMQEQIDAMLERSPSSKCFGERAEEWAIHDYEGFGELRIGEHQGLARIARLARGIGEYGLAFATWAAYVGADNDDLLDQFEDRFQGQWESIEIYAEMLLDELGADRTIDQAPDWLQPYVTVDIAGFARDLELSGDIVTAKQPDGGGWIFAGH